MTDELDTLTDAELSEVFAVEVVEDAGWTNNNRSLWHEPNARPIWPTDYWLEDWRTPILRGAYIALIRAKRAEKQQQGDEK